MKISLNLYFNRLNMIKSLKSLEVPSSRKQDFAAVLLVGDSKLAYDRLSETLLKVAREKAFALEISQLKELPLLWDDGGDSVECDLIVLLTNACDKSSIDTAEKSLLRVPANFFHGHIVMLVQKPFSVSDACVEYERFNILAESYMIPVFWDYPGKTESLACQVIQMAKIAARPSGVPACLFSGIL